jgi:hypothetical protein
MPETEDSPDHSAPPLICEVFAAADLRVRAGANLGDGFGGEDDLCAGDLYILADTAAPRALHVTRAGDAPRVAPGSAVGAAGAPVAIRLSATLMSADGDRVEVLALTAGGLAFALPLSPLVAREGYTLISVNPPPASLRLADLLGAAFARGTRIALADGSLRPVEALALGDRILTRDHGPQPLRWLGSARMRAVGAFAPVIFPPGALGNAGNLAVSPHHRLFLYQPQVRSDLPTAELLVQARHFVDAGIATVQQGGFVDYYSLAFDRHEIVYAEGIPVESLMVGAATIDRLPRRLADEIRAGLPGMEQRPHFGTEADAGVLRPPPRR